MNKLQKLSNKIQKFFHDTLDWDFPVKYIDGDSFQQNYSCKFCEKEITQDSTGAWFHLTSYGN